jgi:sodium pump decarboxylase gamma subunit
MILYVEVMYMTIAEMLEQSAILTVLGMTVVFVFLWLMIVLMNLTAKIIRKFGWDKDVQAPPVPGPQSGASPQVTAAIGAAVTEFRKTEKQQ